MGAKTTKERATVEDLCRAVDVGDRPLVMKILMDAQQESTKLTGGVLPILRVRAVIARIRSMRLSRCTGEGDRVAPRRLICRQA